MGPTGPFRVLLLCLPPGDEEEDEDLSTAQNNDDTSPPIRLQRVGSESPAVDGPEPTPAPVSLPLCEEDDDEDELAAMAGIELRSSASLAPSISLNETGKV